MSECDAAAECVLIRTTRPHRPPTHPHHRSLADGEKMKKNEKKKQIQMIALCQALDYPVRIAYLDRRLVEFSPHILVASGLIY
jgi:hypothetical protein